MSEKQREWVFNESSEIYLSPINRKSELSEGFHRFVLLSAYEAAIRERDEWKKRHTHLAAGCDQTMRRIAELAKELAAERARSAKLVEALREIHIKLTPKIPRMDGLDSWSPYQRFIHEVVTKALAEYAESTGESAK